MEKLKSLWKRKRNKGWLFGVVKQKLKPNGTGVDFQVSILMVMQKNRRRTREESSFVLLCKRENKQTNRKPKERTCLLPRKQVKIKKNKRRKKEWNRLLALANGNWQQLTQLIKKTKRWPCQLQLWILIN